jgi:hypothetical protein
MGLKTILRPFLDTFFDELCTLLFFRRTCEIDGFKCVLAFWPIAVLGFSFWVAWILVERSKSLLQLSFEIVLLVDMPLKSILRRFLDIFSV